MVYLQVFDTLHQANIVPSDISGLENCFTRCEKLFLGLENQYQQNKYFITNFNMIVSILHNFMNFYDTYTCITGAKRYSTWRTTQMEA